MPVGVAWETFGISNGVESFAEMSRSISELRRNDGTNDSVGCVVLSEVVILPEVDYITAPQTWKPNTVRGEYYDLAQDEGARMCAQLMAFSPGQQREKRACRWLHDNGAKSRLRAADNDYFRPRTLRVKSESREPAVFRGRFGRMTHSGKRGGLAFGTVTCSTHSNFESKRRHVMYTPPSNHKHGYGYTKATQTWLSVRFRTEYAPSRLTTLEELGSRYSLQ